MRIDTVTLSNNTRCLLLDQVLTRQTLQGLHDLCRDFETTKKDWIPADWTDHRWYYQGNSVSWQRFQDEIQYPVEISQSLGVDLVASASRLWVDLEGYGALNSHVEGEGRFLSQISLAQHSWPDQGTAIYLDQATVLFQLPYRDNSGWFFDGSTKIWHGRQHAIPPGLKRFVVMTWYGQR